MWDRSTISSTKVRLLIALDDARHESAASLSDTKNCSNFADNMTIDDILTPADKQVCINFALDSIKAQAEERHVAGYSTLFLYHGQSIIHALISEELIVNMFSLHDKERIKRLGSEWWNLRQMIRPQPIEKIRNYFGDSIALYFSFVGKFAAPAKGT